MGRVNCICPIPTFSPYNSLSKNENIEEVRELTEKWRKNYNENRPHEALGNMTPLDNKHKLLTGETLQGWKCIYCGLGHFNVLVRILDEEKKQ